MKLIEWAMRMPGFKKDMSKLVDDFIPHCDKCPIRKKCDEKYDGIYKECWEIILENLEVEIDV